MLFRSKAERPAKKAADNQPSQEKKKKEGSPEKKPEGGPQAATSSASLETLPVGRYALNEPRLARFVSLGENCFKDSRGMRVLKKGGFFWVLRVPHNHLNRGAEKVGLYNALSGHVFRRNYLPDDEIPTIEQASEGMLNAGHLFSGMEGEEGSHSCGADCDCPPITASKYIPARVSNFCEKTKLYKREKMGNRGAELVMGNSWWRFKSNGSKFERLVPQPQGISGRWEDRVVKKTLGGVGCSFKNAMFFSLLDAAGADSMQRTYESSPSSWTPDNHPLFAEPNPESELASWSQQGYGAESLQRLHLGAHPARGDRVPLYSLTNVKTLQTPVLINNRSPFAVEDLIYQYLAPYLRCGAGIIFCPICLFSMENGRAEPVLLTRSEYCRHYRQFHSSGLGACSLYFPTRLHTRSYEALCIYLALRSDTLGHADDKPDDEALAIPAGAGLEYVTTLNDIVTKLGGTGVYPLFPPLGVEDLANLYVPPATEAGQAQAGAGPAPAPQPAAEEAAPPQPLDPVSQAVASIQDQELDLQTP